MLDTLATARLSIKRPPAVTGGKRGAPVAVAALRNLPCTPLNPVDNVRAQELIARLKLPTTIVLLEAYAVGRRDIRPGDVAEVDGEDFPVRSVAKWTGFGSASLHTHFIVEDIRP
jgi:hypothetical protein